MYILLFEYFVFDSLINEDMFSQKIIKLDDPNRPEDPLERSKPLS